MCYITSIQDSTGLHEGFGIGLFIVCLLLALYSMYTVVPCKSLRHSPCGSQSFMNPLGDLVELCCQFLALSLLGLAF